MVLLAACSDATLPSAGQQAACAYAPINIDTASLPKPVKYPPGFPIPSPVPPGSPTYGLQELQDPPVAQEGPITVEPQGKYVRNYNPLQIQYSNPGKKAIAGCGLTLRTYNGGLVAPTLRAKPGQTLRFTVENNLPVTPSPSPSPPPHGATHSLDTTNLHTHGLHVDPVGKTVGGEFISSDNVLINYDPPKQQKYEIAIPDDHPSGTFWYHAHSHGSTAVQVSSGMAGAIIVEDDKSNLDKPESDRSMIPDSLKVSEKILVFQSILYNEEGEIADLDLSGPAQPWGASQRRITINGQLVPRITMRPGEVQRWRMIGSTFEELLELQLAGHDLNEVALDSLYLPRVDAWSPDKGQTVELEAGYRSDVLVKASTEPGTYMLVDAGEGPGRLASPTALQADVEKPSVVAAVVVEGTPEQGKALPTSDEMRQIAYGWTGGTEDVPLEDLWNKDPVNQDPDPLKRHLQSIHFNLGPLTGQNPESHFAINHNVYPDGGVRTLVLDRIDRWELVTETDGRHLFHIHVNPFQAFRAGPDGQPERVWKDTLSVEKNNGPGQEPVIVYTKYKRFTGRFVIHCHLLDHEDNGMMQQVEVVNEAAS